MIRPNEKKSSALAKCCMSFVTSLPVIFLVIIIGWSYYAYVVAMCIFSVQSIPEKIIYLLLYHPILAIFLWSYAAAVFTKPIQPPREFFLTIDECEYFMKLETEELRRAYLEQLVQEKNLPVQTRGINGGVRFCNVCYLIKPDRAHHCSACESCLLKMDHHCPWVNNCVGFHNYKFFVIFLGHGFLYCLYIACTSLQYFINFWKDTTNRFSNFNMLGFSRKSSQSDQGNITGTDQNLLDDIPAFKFNILFVFFVAFLFAICLVGLFGYHIWLTLKNRTTLESFRATMLPSGPNKDAFSLGRGGNFRAVFGSKCLTAFLPLFTSQGDGIHWEVNTFPPNYHSMESGTPFREDLQ